MNEHSGTKDRVEGQFHQVNGKIKEVVGNMFDNQYLKTEGKKENLSGKVQDKVGQVKKVFGM